ncbi:MAG: PfkB family carbohydrate kinase [Candidatus Omnitrophica bacterium]|nr:PfkB family carbohydrate kinase [Candidatus Omnitrophota bacterium]
MSILVLGTVALDTVRTPSGVREKMLGGSAVHFAMSSRLFTKVNLAAVIGSDFPLTYIHFLKRKGIIINSLIKEEGLTFKWEGEYRGDLNTALTINTELGVLATFKPCISQEQKKIKNIFLANVDPDIQLYFLSQSCPGAFVGLDSMNFWIKNKRQSLLKVLKKADIFVANDQEARDLSEETNLLKAAKKLHALGPRMVLIKKGEHGLFFYSNSFIFSLPAYPTEKVTDPTGAGDTFAGGFMGYLAAAKKINASNLKNALVYGTVAASFNVEDFGVERTSGITLRQLNQRVKEFKKIISL